MKPVIGILTRYDVNQKGRCLNYVFDSTRTAVLKMGGNPLLLCPMQNMEYYDTKYEDYVLPTEEEKKLAKDAGIELEIVPVVKEAFVFFVNKENIIDNLTLNQIQDIYSGKITNWKEVGGADAQILAYQRPQNSGSQSGMLSLVMQGIKMKEPEKETIAQSMVDIVDVISDYQNKDNAIGYSYYYYICRVIKSKTL